MCLFACYSQYCKRLFKLEWTRLWGRGPLWHLEHFAGTGGRRGELWNHCSEKQAYPKGIGLRRLVTAPLPEHGNISHRAKPPTYGKATVRKRLAESQACSPEPLHSTQGNAGSQPQAAAQWPGRQGPPKVAGQTNPSQNVTLSGRCPLLTMSPG